MAKEKLLITLAVLIKAVIAVTVEVAVEVETKVEVEVAVEVVLVIEVEGFPSSPSTHSPSGFAFLVASLANSMLGPTPVL